MNRRKFIRGSTAAAVSTSLYSSQSIAAALQALLQVTSDVDAITGDGASTIL